jgi:sugar phosphate isomerase/epimerase
MKIGTFSPEIASGNAAELFKKAKDYGFSQTQFDFLSVGKEEMPEFIPDSLVKEIAVEAKNNGIEITAINGTFNMSHPDPAVRQDGIKRFEKIAAVCGALSCNLITLCTGSRTKESMWIPHPDNDTPEAWKDMSASMEQLVSIADRYNVNLGIETEASNVVNTPQKAKKLIEEFGSARLKIIMDAANLFRAGMAKKEKVRGVIGEAFELLGQYVAIAHGKDIKEGDGIDFTGAGKGIIDFDFFFSELEKIKYKGGIIIHGIKQEKDIPYCMDFIKKKVEPFKSFDSY